MRRSLDRLGSRELLASLPCLLACLPTSPLLPGERERGLVLDDSGNSEGVFYKTASLSGEMARERDFFPPSWH